MKKFSQIKKSRITKIVEDLENNETDEATQVEQEEIQDGDSDVIKFFSKIFESREMAHVYHLQVRGEEGSNAAHKALGHYYEDILDLLDDTIEVYQGQYGVIGSYESIDTDETRTKDFVVYFEEVADYIKHAKQCFSEEDTHIHSLVDDIVCLVYRTLYKLKFTK